MRHLIWAVLGLITLAGGSAGANVAPGDKPQLEFRAADGTTVSLAALQGKIVVVDFWATWCGPCMAEAAHMVKLNQDYGPKGVVFLGISLDENKQMMQTVARQKGFTWPQYFDGLVWKNRIGVAWGVQSIPQTFLISPEGEVLWRGHPARIDPVLDKALREHPPQLVDPRTLAEANKTLDQAEAAMTAGNELGAVKLLAKVPNEATLDSKLAQRVQAVQSKLQAFAEQALAETDALVEKKEFAAAADRLKALSTGLSGLPVGAKATARLVALKKNPEAAAQIAARQKAEHGAEALAVARQLQADKKDEQAYLRFKEVAQAFADTPSGPQAAQAVAQYEKDPAFVRRVNGKATEGKARAALSMADNYRRAGRTDRARQKYQELIKQYPDSESAETARQDLAKLDKP